jgi:hypothetical protein
LQKWDGSIIYGWIWIVETVLTVFSSIKRI